MACGLFLLGQGMWIHAKAYAAQILLERAFTQSIATGEKIKPWSWADTWPVARIEAPRLAALAIALNGASGQALALVPAICKTHRKPVKQELRSMQPIATRILFF